MSVETQPWTAAYDDWIDPDLEIPSCSYTEMMEKAFGEFPERPAYHFMGHSVTYREFDDQTARFANYFHDQGLGKGDVVAFILPNIPQYLTVMAGALRAGCTITGISILLTAKEITFQINDSGAKALVCLDATYEQKIVGIADEIPTVTNFIVTNIADTLAAIKRFVGKALRKIPSGKVSPIDGRTTIWYKEVLRLRPPQCPEVSVDAMDTMLLQYTGGTTGFPKGAIIPHRNMVANAEIAIHWFNQGRGVDRILSAFPLFHIAGASIAFQAMCHGNTQILIADPRNTKYLCDMVRQHRPTLIVNVPSLYMMLMETPEWHKLDFSDCKGFFSGAAPFAVESIKALEAVVGEGRVVEGYGMTETSGAITANPFAGPKKIGSVGVPFPRSGIKIFDIENPGQEVAPGEEGELALSGPLITTGYHNRPEETAKALREIDGEQWLFTGDVARMDEDGFFYIVDRAKDMIVVSGFKVFSTEVEAKLIEHPAVAQCAFVGEEDPERPGSEIVKAFVQVSAERADDDHATIKEEITAYCRENMAAYKVPKIIEIIDEIPLTAVGKIDKKALR